LGRVREAEPYHGVRSRSDNSEIASERGDPPPARELVWTAGFFEGAGSFFRNRGVPTVKAGQVQPEPLERLRTLYGGSIQRRPRLAPRQDQWDWRVTGKPARALMLELLPLVSPRRRARIEAVLAEEAPNA